MQTRKITYLATLLAVSLIIFIIEVQLPVIWPLPGVKLGLANIITVYAVDYFSAGEVVLLLISRIVLGTVFTGNFLALTYSLSGAAVALAGILALRRVFPGLELCLCSDVSGFLHNLGQLTAAFFLLGTPEVFLYLPVLTVAGAVAGAFTGIAVQQLLCHKSFAALNNKNF